MRAPFARLLSYWSDRRDGRDMPARSDIDPLQIRDLIGDLSIVDVRQGDARYVYRLHCSRQVELLGQELTGKPATAIRIVEVRDQLLRQLDETVGARKPLLFRAALASVPGAPAYERLVLPLSADGRQPNMVMTMVLPVDRSIRTLEDWYISPSASDPLAWSPHHR